MIMSLRFSALMLALCLLLGLAACSKPQTADNSQMQQPPATAADNTTNSSTNAPAQGQENQAPPMQQAQAPAAAPAEKAAPAPKPKIVPAGTVIRVRLNDAIGSKTAQAGQTFTGSVMDPIVVDGRTLIPAGASVAGEVTDAKSAGRFKGAAELAITIRSVTVGGVPHTLAASTVSQTSTGKGKRSAALIGGGGGAGALIGGLAGGGKGALIGALAGAGAGTAGAGLTGNREITLPAESAVSFKLTQALHLN
jgi:hypothetical protein